MEVGRSKENQEAKMGSERMSMKILKMHELEGRSWQEVSACCVGAGEL